MMDILLRYSEFATVDCGSCLASRTVLGGKGSLRRGPPRRALASCAPFRTVQDREGRIDLARGEIRFITAKTGRRMIIPLSEGATHPYRLPGSERSS
jgi:hypothetical protein